MESKEITAVSFDLRKKPSHSKGWIRFKANANGSPIIASRTGNEFVSANHNGTVENGTPIIVTTQVMLKHGKGRTFREEITTVDHQLIVDSASVCEIGSAYDYFHIVVSGARING